MDNCFDNINIESISDVNAQHERDHHDIRDERGKKPCIHDDDRVLGDRGLDSSLLFFFLLLVVIVCQFDIDIDMDTLLWFFLLLVVLYKEL
jgi:hypothetical protein